MRITNLWCDYLVGNFIIKFPWIPIVVFTWLLSHVTQTLFKIKIIIFMLCPSSNYFCKVNILSLPILLCVPGIMTISMTIMPYSLLLIKNDNATIYLLFCCLLQVLIIKTIAFQWIFSFRLTLSNPVSIVLLDWPFWNVNLNTIALPDI